TTYAEAPTHLPDAVLEVLAPSLCLNSTADIVHDEHGNRPPTYVGDKTECALLAWAETLGVPYQPMRRRAADQILRRDPFSSKKKRMGTVVQLGARRSYLCKGAAEVLVAQAVSVREPSGREVPL